MEAAFFTCLIPTTGGLLGPAFMVPMALGLLFIPLSLFMAYNVRSPASYLIIFLFTCFLLMSHATTAVILSILLLPYIILHFKSERARSLGILASVAFPFVLATPLIINIITSRAGQLFTQQFIPSYVEVPALLWKYGLLPLAVSLIGTIFLIWKGGRKNLSLILGLVILVAVLLVYIRLHYGLEEIYERGLTTVLLLLSVLAGAGFFFLRTLKLPAGFRSRFQFAGSQNARIFGCSVIVAAALIIAIPTRMNAVFYHIIDDHDYQSFTWIKDNSGTGYRSAVVDPWKATAFTAVTGTNIAHRIWFQPELGDEAIVHFLETGCTNEAFMKDNKLSFVYSSLPCNNNELIKVRDRVFLTSPNISNSFATENELQNDGFEAVYGNPPEYWDRWSQNCQPTFLFPETGRGDGWCAGIRMYNSAPYQSSPVAIWSQDICVQPGKSYVVGGWIKTENIQGQGGAMIVPHWKGAGGIWISASEFMPYIMGTNGWTYYEGKVTAPAGAKICSICCLIAECSGTAWYDDILFKDEPNSQSQSDYLVKPSFNGQRLIKSDAVNRNQINCENAKQ